LVQFLSVELFISRVQAKERHNSESLSKAGGRPNLIWAY